MGQLIQTKVIDDIKVLLQNARNKVINTTMTQTYWQIGQKIVEEEQAGKSRATYGKGLIKKLSKELTDEFGRGFSTRNIEHMRQFYICFSKSQTVSAKFMLSWSHYIFLTRISNKKERSFYEKVAKG